MWCSASGEGALSMILAGAMVNVCSSDGLSKMIIDSLCSIEALVWTSYSLAECDHWMWCR